MLSFLQPQADLTAKNTLALPARAEWLAPIDAIAQLAAIAHSPEWARQPRFVLGGGSNLVLSGELPGITLAIALKGRAKLAEDADAHYLAAAAGENWHDFVGWTLREGCPGLENLALIPGTVGAAPVQNIGAYGREAGEFIDHLDAFDMESGEMCRFDRANCAFGYRQSVFKREGCQNGRHVITRVVFRLPKRWQPCVAYSELAAELARRGKAEKRQTPLDVAAAVMALRRKKLPDPAILPNAGSFFQNPAVSAALAAALGSIHPTLPRYPQADGSVKLAAGWLIEQVGWKGRNLGRVGMYEQQALVLVNRGGATASDVRNLARAVREAVFARFGVHLELEPVQAGKA
ncbi:MAG: UDP-N-acetylmuramate dehydrogenase [Zoogloeaceae bacterium]|jgi:UDP-N-acetylmuramate dehydrogenase|nr:UDP-N-acetylmuramate dehydrogenase [Zoogloeaceae bacterium]